MLNHLMQSGIGGIQEAKSHDSRAGCENTRLPSDLRITHISPGSLTTYDLVSIKLAHYQIKVEFNPEFECSRLLLPSETLCKHRYTPDHINLERSPQAFVPQQAGTHRQPHLNTLPITVCRYHH